MENLIPDWKDDLMRVQKIVCEVISIDKAIRIFLIIPSASAIMPLCPDRMEFKRIEMVIVSEIAPDEHTNVFTMGILLTKDPVRIPTRRRANGMVGTNYSRASVLSPVRLFGLVCKYET